MSISNPVSKQSGTEISSQINGISSLPTESSTNAKDQEEQRKRYEVPGSEIRIVLEREDDKHQHRAGDDFRENLARLGQEGLRIRAEDAGGGVVGKPGDRADGAAALELVDGGLVVAVDNGRGAEAAHDLRACVDGELPPREFAVQAIDERDGWVEVSACAAGYVDAEHDADAPAVVEG